MCVSKKGWHIAD